MDRMSTSGETLKTRVWWDGGEVDFICWTEKSLIFSWRDVTETAVQLPRGAVVRLLEKGVLVVEGEMPSWIYQVVYDLQRAAVQAAPPAQSSAAHDSSPATQAATHQSPAPEAAPDSAPVRFNVVSRLIRRIARLQPDSD